MSAESTFKNTSSFFSKCADTFLSFLKVLMLSRPGVKMPVAPSESCIVLGNGPSLKTSLQQHHGTFAKEQLVCVNNFSTLPEFTTLKPNYYVVLDFAFWLSDDQLILDTIEALKTKTTWELHLFVPRLAAKTKRFDELARANTHIHLHYFNYSVFKGFESICHHYYKRNLAMPQSQNVLVAAIFLAINSGFKKITVVGADHTWHEHLHLDQNNVLHFKNIHFFENEEKVEYKPFKKGLHLAETFKMHEVMHIFAKTFLGYDLVNKYAENRGAKIYNSSEVSFIDAFERKKL